MTAKEKAKELIDRFRGHHIIIKRNTRGRPVNPYISLDMQKSVIDIQAVECALICVDETLEAIDNAFNGYYTMPKEWQNRIDYWEEVKQEIQSL